MQTRLLAALAALTLLSLPTDLHAQSNRDGFFIGLGLGAGSLGVEDADDRESGLSGHFRIGAAVSDAGMLGIETVGWTKEEGGIRLTQGSALATVYFYPTADGPLYLKGGLGISTLDLEITGFGSGDDTGNAFMLGLGVDALGSGSLTISPWAAFTQSNYTGGSTTLLQLGLGLAWY